MVVLSCKFFHLPDGEQAPVQAPCSAQQGADVGDEIRGYANSEAAQVNSETQDVVYWGDKHFHEFVPRNGVLAML